MLDEGQGLRVRKKDLERAEDEILRVRATGDIAALADAVAYYETIRLHFDRYHARWSFIYFVRLVRPDLMIGPHHRIMARAFRKMARRELLRVIISMPPGWTKSQFTSVCLPAWLYGLTPDGRVLHATHTKDLVEGFGREVRDLLQTDEYRRLFPDTKLRQDVKAAARWYTTKRGRYVGASVGTAVAGKRADAAGIIDDPISEQDAYSEKKRKNVIAWYPGGFRTRLLPDTPIALIMTRWHNADLAGWLIEEARKNPKKERWTVINIPALADAAASKMLKVPVGESTFPQLWPTKEVEQIREEMPPHVWSALYCGKPTEDEGRILLKSWWKPWKKDRALPQFDYVIQCWDTAYEEDEEADGDFCACTTWGVFQNEATGRAALFLLARYNKRVGFPTLRKDAQDAYKRYEPDVVLVEPKASGKSLVQELRLANVPCREWQPERGSRGREKSKYARTHAASVVLSDGDVFYPEGYRWAQEIIEQCAQFPLGEHDDLVDTCSMAWLWLRRTWRVELSDEDKDDEKADGEDALSLNGRSDRPTEAAYG